MRFKYFLFLAIGFFVFVGVASAANYIGTTPGANPEAPLFLKGEGGANIEGQLNAVVGKTDYGASADVTLQEAIFQIVRYLLEFIGVIFVVVILYGGFIWMTSGGNEEKIGKAKKWLVNGTIGAAIVFSSLSIWIFIIEKIYIASTESFQERAAPDCVNLCDPGDTDCWEKCQTEYQYP